MKYILSKDQYKVMRKIQLCDNNNLTFFQFLKYGEGLSKAAIGNYIGERIDFNEDVLKAFVDLHDFKHLILVEALRQFLWSFRLPGESQKISRMLDAFAERYCQLNPGMFSADTCSVLCYSIIMLNTELHNPNVKVSGECMSDCV
jgi:cytohesin